MTSRRLAPLFFITLLLTLGLAFNNCSRPLGDSATANTLASANPLCVVTNKLNSATAVSPFLHQKVHGPSEEDEALILYQSNCANPQTPMAELSSLGLSIQKIETSAMTADWLADMEEDPCVIGVAPNRQYHPNLVEADFDDLRIGEQDHLSALGFWGSLTHFYSAENGLHLNQSAPKSIVAVIDTGVHYDHPDLVENIHQSVNGIGVDATTLYEDDVDPVYDGRDVDDFFSHGTHVSGLIAAQGANGTGVTGLAPRGVEILPINIFYKEDPDDIAVVSDSRTLIKALAYVIEHGGVDVVNLSLGGSQEDPALELALRQLISRGIVVVAAAGNNSQELSSNFSLYPASYGRQIPGLITVGSVNSNDRTRSGFSNFSSSEVEIAAYGSETSDRGVLSTFGTNQYARLRGTSQAAPQVAAAAALTIAMAKRQGQTLSPQTLERLILQSARKSQNLTSDFQNGNVLDLTNLGLWVNRTLQGQSLSNCN